jgi:hypothetical protein
MASRVRLPLPSQPIFVRPSRYAARKGLGSQATGPLPNQGDGNGSHHVEHAEQVPPWSRRMFCAINRAMYHNVKGGQHRLPPSKSPAS